ncbi:hypothetical protein DPEC_G00188670 [Dallia pectoralis]|uniref:Uncharacterized protein n=1 Tax=Dallia pectoralis TaxID=75939 RepID=A0ACC2GCC0_DALPE|nr:hypothetical protein DPEC_G00188670 [Dallia pectoralis]
MAFKDSTPKEDFLTLIPMKEKTRGEDVYNDFKNYPSVPDPAPVGGVWEGIPQMNSPSCIPVAEDYTSMLRTTWKKPSQKPQFNAGCRRLANARYPKETGLGDMPPVEQEIASWTTLGPAYASANPRCPKECAKTDRLISRSFNSTARAARTGNALAILLTALGKTLQSSDQGLGKHKGRSNLSGLDRRVAILLVFKGRAFVPKDKILPLIPRGDSNPVGEPNREVHEGVQDVMVDLHRSQGLTVDCSSQLSRASWERVNRPVGFIPIFKGQNDGCQGATIGACIEGGAALAPLQLRGIKILPYLDDWLICAPFQEQVIRNTEEVLAHIQSLGFTVNWKKSSLQPQHQVKFLGLYFNSITMEACLTPQRIDSLEKALGHFQKGKLVTAHRVQKLVGRMAAASMEIPLGLLRTRPIQRWFNSFRLHPKKDRRTRLLVTKAGMRALLHWRDKDFLRRGTPLGNLPQRRSVITTDASLTGKSTRRDEITTLSPGGNEPADMDVATTVLTESNPHPRCDKQGSRHFVQNRASPRGVAVAHGGPPEDQGGSLHSSASCSTLAGNTMVPGPSSAGSGSSVATSVTGRSPIPNTRADLASKPDGTTIVGMASAESVPQQLDETVRETLDNARAPSTRANYSIRFLQAQLDQGKAASTIRGYASAISASHQGWPAIRPTSLGRSVPEGSWSLMSKSHFAGT